MQSAKKRSPKPKGPRKKHTKSLLGRIEEARGAREKAREVAAGEYHKALDKAQMEYWRALAGLSGKGSEGWSRMSHLEAFFPTPSSGLRRGGGRSARGAKRVG